MINKIYDNDKKNAYFTILFCSLVLLQLLLLFYFGNQKKGFFIDELWSYNLSNSYMFPFIGDAKDYFGRWLPSSFFLDSLTVQPDQKFEYGSVFASQAADVHPPLYYYLFHTISSLTRGVFSKWQGLILNFIFFAGNQFILWKISNQLIKDKIISLFIVAFYGFSVSALSTFLIIRMYALLTFFTLLITYLIILFDRKKRIPIALCVAITLSYFLGFHTQYYFVIYAFFISAFYCIFLLLIKKYNKLFIFISCTLLGIFSSIICFTPSLHHIFDGYRGKEAFSNFGSAGFIQKVDYYLNAQLSQSIFLLLFGLSSILLLFLLLRKFVKFEYSKTESRLLVICDFSFKPYLRFEISSDRILIGIIFLASLISYLFVVQLSSITDVRYIYFVVPLLDLVAVSIFFNISGLLIKKKITLYFIFFLILLSFSASNIRTNNIHWIHKKEGQAIELVKNTQDSRIIYIDKNEFWWPTMAYFNFFINAKEVEMITENNISKIKLPKNIDRVFIVISRFCNKQNIIKYLNEKLNLKDAKVIYEDWHGQVYELSK
ncbi:YfhO family protein [Parasutterella muris]|uniref:Glycosyltransferase RgtA/B/C/D-like domain-containing protein n=1 Tax=Parasutterella muris TaxID=2565572 RepID=A0A6L6YFN3_9BURK|nr:YfhO family protein [Parasutterella muris]MVX56460.1 hypothetical protein [Parasutterella muris]